MSGVRFSLAVNHAIRMVNIGKRFRDRRTQLGWSSRKVATLAEISQSLYSKIELGKSEGSQKTLMKVSGALGFTLEDLYTRPGNPKEISIDLRRVPLLTEAQASLWFASKTRSEDAEMFPLVSTTVECSLSAFGMKLADNSMEPDFKKGDVIVCDPNLQPYPGCYVIANELSTGLVVFRAYADTGINSSGDMTFELIPMSRFFRSMRSDRHKLLIQGVAVEHRRFLSRAVIV